MKTIISVEGRTLELCANAATPLRYKMIFGEDLLTTLQKRKDEETLTEIGETVSKLAYIMSKQNEGTASDATFEDYLNWLETVDDPMAFTTGASDILQFYMQNVKTTSTPKNARGPRTGK